AKLGNPRNASDAAALGRRAQNRMPRFASNTLPIVEAIRAAGVTDLPGTATALNARGIRGGRWHVSNVKNLPIASFSLIGGKNHAGTAAKKSARDPQKPLSSLCYQLGLSLTAANRALAPWCRTH